MTDQNNVSNKSQEINLGQYSDGKHLLILIASREAIGEFMVREGAVIDVGGAAREVLSIGLHGLQITRAIAEIGKDLLRSLAPEERNLSMENMTEDEWAAMEAEAEYEAREHEEWLKNRSADEPIGPVHPDLAFLLERETTGL